MQNLEELHSLLRESKWLGPNRFLVSPATYLEIYQRFSNLLMGARFIVPKENEEGFGAVSITLKSEAITEKPAIVQFKYA